MRPLGLRRVLQIQQTLRQVKEIVLAANSEKARGGKKKHTHTQTKAKQAKHWNLELLPLKYLNN